MKMAKSDFQTHWNVTFKWTERHQTREQLRPQMFTYDSLADECVKRLNEISEKDNKDDSNGKSPKKDLFALLEKHADEDPTLQQLWTEIHTVPEWVDWDQVKRGQEVFFRYGMAILNVLNFQSLLGGMGSNRVVETLARTGGFSASVVRRRLLETLQHVLQVSLSLESIKPGGAGHKSSVQVRLLHASVRSRILGLVKENPKYYDVEQYGIPISDLDCIATINTFSTSVVWMGLPRQGIWLREQEILDYIALWRLVAYYMGTPNEVFATKQNARAMMESLLASEVDPKPTGVILAKNIVIGLENTFPSFTSKEFMEAMARQLNGDKLADGLDIPRTSLYYRTLIYGYCFVVMTMAYGNRYFPMFDKLSIAIRRKYYFMSLTHSEGLRELTNFEFKFIPSPSRTTQLGKRQDRKVTKVGVEALAKLGVLAAGASLTSAMYVTFIGFSMIAPHVRPLLKW